MLLQELGARFHRLDNQLGIALANAELLEARAKDLAQRARAGQVITGLLDAMTTVRELRALLLDVPPDHRLHTPPPAQRPAD